MQSSNKYLELEVFSTKHLPEAKAICDAQFGKDYLSIKDLSLYTTAPHLGLVATDTQHLLGLTLIKIGDTEQIGMELLAGQDWFLSEFKIYTKIALRKHLVVLPGYERHGIGAGLMKAGMALLEEKGIQAIVSVVWKEGDSEALHKLLTNYDSFPIRTLPDYWKEDSLQKQYICPGCKQLPCQCSVIVYAKVIQQK